MSHTTPPPHAAMDAAHGEGHGHPRFLAHHFGSVRQQFDAGKFGMWLFLITEILFFSGLFCVYAIYRTTHSAAFASADKYLDSTLGATNTAVLLFSSLTMAWAVRASQLGQQKLLVKLLTLTLACASIFLGVKAVEYSHKWDSGILWASQFNPLEHAAHSSALLVLSTPAIVATLLTGILFVIARSKHSSIAAPFWGCLALTSVAFFVGVGIGKGVPLIEQAITGQSHETVGESHAAAEHDAGSAHPVEQTRAVHAGPDDQARHKGEALHGNKPAVSKPEVSKPVDHSHAGHAVESKAPVSPAQHATMDSQSSNATPKADVNTSVSLESKTQAENERIYTGIFFSIYYVMTGLHAVHILAGMGAISWLLWRSLRGDFGPDYFGPVDYVGLYWHLVDLIWIYLFPLLYLIG